MLVVLGIWGATTEIEGAIVARGTLQFEGERKVVEHPDGGVVSAILVRDGDAVEAGDVLMRLDETYLVSELAVVEGQLSEIFARRQRLTAEREGFEAPVFDNRPTFTTVSMNSFDELMAGQLKLFRVRLSSLRQEAHQINEQAFQVQRQIEGMQAQLAALNRQLAFVSEEKADIQSLFDRGLIERRRLLEMYHEEARLQGDIGELKARIAEARSRIAALEVEHLKLGDHRREEAITRLRDLNYSAIEFQERRAALQAQIARLEVRSPVTGIVFDNRVSTLNSVVRPAEPMMYIAPSDVPLEVAIRIDPKDIDQVFLEQPATLMFSAFNRRTTPEVPGRVRQISPDVATDESTGEAHYRAFVVVEDSVADIVPDLEFVPGMPVEVFLKTGKRTPVNYLTEPLTDYFQRAFREE